MVLEGLEIISNADAFMIFAECFGIGVMIGFVVYVFGFLFNAMVQLLRRSI